VRSHEPITALDGGPDGLYFFRAIVTNWISSLKPGGSLLFECGFDQAEAVSEIMIEAGLRNIKTHLDTLGIERVIAGTLK
jgi:release factor glutamine methyltransferase